MRKNKNCLENGIFSLSTVKKLENVYDRDEEKLVIRSLLEQGSWFSISGLRRTGKTTLIRSVAETLENFVKVYINAWELPYENVFDSLMEVLKDELYKVLAKSELKKIAEKIRKLSFLGISVELKEKHQTRLTSILRDIANKKPLIVILDEAPDLFMDNRTGRFLAALKDSIPKGLTVVFTGSIVSMREILNAKESMPLYGRIEEEIILNPFDTETSKNFLIHGFNQCGVEPSEEVIELGARKLGGFAGWLTLYGRIITRRKLSGLKLDLDKIINDLNTQASEVIYGEIARFLRGKKNFNIYLKIMKLAAIEGDITVSRAARAVNRAPSTVVFYIEKLVKRGLLAKQQDYYIISDPLIRETAQRPEFEREVKTRL